MLCLFKIFFFFFLVFYLASRHDIGESLTRTSDARIAESSSASAAIQRESRRSRSRFPLGSFLPRSRSPLFSRRPGRALRSCCTELCTVRARRAELRYE